MRSAGNDRPGDDGARGGRARDRSTNANEGREGRGRAKSNASVHSRNDSTYGGSKGSSPRPKPGQTGTSTPANGAITPFNDSAYGTREASPNGKSGQPSAGSGISTALVRHANDAFSSAPSTSEKRWVPYTASTTFDERRWKIAVHHQLDQALTSSQLETWTEGFRKRIMDRTDWNMQSKHQAAAILEDISKERIAKLGAARDARPKVKVLQDNELDVWSKSCAERFRTAHNDQALLAARTSILPVMEAFARAHAPDKASYKPYHAGLQARMNDAFKHQQGANAAAAQRKQAEEQVRAEQQRKEKLARAEQERLQKLQPRAHKKLRDWDLRCQTELYQCMNYTELATACDHLGQLGQPSLERNFPILGQPNAYRDALWSAFSTQRDYIKAKVLNPLDDENGGWFPWKVVKSKPLDTSREWASAPDKYGGVRGGSAFSRSPYHQGRGPSAEGAGHSTGFKAGFFGVSGFGRVGLAGASTRWIHVRTIACGYRASGIPLAAAACSSRSRSRRAAHQYSVCPHPLSRNRSATTRRT